MKRRKQATSITGQSWPKRWAVLPAKPGAAAKMVSNDTERVTMNTVKMPRR